MSLSDIEIRGASEHNLQHVELKLPRNRLICFTGVSGSGKSSLAFDTLYAEGQRRYVESLSSYARQFLGQLPKPQVEQISGLSPAISISQKSGGQNSRSTVGTVTEIYDFLRVLFARVSSGFCPKCGKPISAQTRQQMIDRIETFPKGTRFLILAPLIKGQKGEYKDLFSDLKKKGFVRVRVDGRLVRLDDELRLDRQMRHFIEVVVDRLVLSGTSTRSRLAEAVELALSLGNGQMIAAPDFSESNLSTNSIAPNSTTSNSTALNSIASGSSESDFSAADFDELVPSALDFSVSDSTAFDSFQQQGDNAPKFLTGESLPTDLASKKEAASVFDRDISFSAHFACPDCRINFEAPTPQMFSFNGLQGMCPDCEGLGIKHTFDPTLLIPDPSKSFQQGAVEPIGTWKDLGRWKRHIFRGVADTWARVNGLGKDHCLLETAWEEVNPKFRDALLWGTGDLHITFTWRNGENGHKWGGSYDGIVPKMQQQYRETKNKMQKAFMEKYMNIIPCTSCQGTRLNEQARSFKMQTDAESGIFQNKKWFSLPELCQLSILELLEFFRYVHLEGSFKIIAEEALKEIRNRLGFLVNVGLDYLSLGRGAPTLSGGEMQRIRLASQIGSGLTGVLYVLDEPSIGLHPRDNDRLIETLTRLRDLGNTVVVVEHDEDTMLASDYLVDFGPGPGVHGGEIVSAGTVDDVLKNTKSLTAQFLSRRETIETPSLRKKPGDKFLSIRGATHNNLKNIDVDIPLGLFVCVTGVSGSGKSSLVNDILVESLMTTLNHGNGNPGAFREMLGVEHLDKLIAIDQSPIGRTPRSNPSTYIKLFDDIRKLFSELPDAKAKGFAPGRFSFNVSGGRCEACEGNGAQKMEMDFLADIWVTCPVCQGRRFNEETLSVKFKGKSIDEILNMDVETALNYFENFPKIHHKLMTLHNVGLGYMQLGQASPTLSGGEAQRIKLAKELVKKSTGKTLYLLDEPTTGLHFADIRLLLDVLKSFSDAGNTVLVVEHNLDVIKTADWLIDLGPEGGEAGGKIIAAGTPEELMNCPESYTGQALKRYCQRDALDLSAFERFRKPLPSSFLTTIQNQSVQNQLAQNQTTDQNQSVQNQLAQNQTTDQNQAVQNQLAQNQSTDQNQAVQNQLTQNQIADPNLTLLDEKTSRKQEYEEPDFGEIVVKGASEHNLQSVSLTIPHNKMTVCCGASGSGKSSLAMDTIYAEGQRRYVESLSSYARQFLGQMQKPKVEQIEGIAPAIAIEQKTTSHSPRSTVGTVTEILDYLRVLFARLGVSYCPQCDQPVGTQTTDDIINRILLLPAETRFLLTAPLTVEVGTKYETLWKKMKEQGFARVRIDGKTVRLEDVPDIDRRSKHDVELVVDRLKIPAFSDAVLSALSQKISLTPDENSVENLTRLNTHSSSSDNNSGNNSNNRSDSNLDNSDSNLSFAESKLRFSSSGGVSNNLSEKRSEESNLNQNLNHKLDFLIDPEDRARRLEKEILWTQKHFHRHFSLENESVLPSETFNISDSNVSQPDVLDSASSVSESSIRLPLMSAEAEVPSFQKKQEKLQPRVLSELKDILKKNDENSVSSEDISQKTTSKTSEIQSENSSENQQNNQQKEQNSKRQNTSDSVLSLSKAEELLLRRSRSRVADSVETALEYGRDVLNIVIIDENCPENEWTTLRQSRQMVCESCGRSFESLSAHHFSFNSPLGWCPHCEGLGVQKGAVSAEMIRDSKRSLLEGALVFPAPDSNLLFKKMLLAISRDTGLPLDVPFEQLAGRFRRLIFHGAGERWFSVYDESEEETLSDEKKQRLNLEQKKPLLWGSLKEKSSKKLLFRFQYKGLYPAMDEASRLVPSLRSEYKILEETECSVCLGSRLREDVSAVRFAGQTLDQICRQPLGDLIRFFDAWEPNAAEEKIAGDILHEVRNRLHFLVDLGLEYLTLARPAQTLSGGETQRIRLAAQVGSGLVGVLYVLDEPTIGLHPRDNARLITALKKLRDLGNTVLTVEHDRDVIQSADKVIDFGPQAGKFGGRIVAEGTPDEIMNSPTSITGPFLSGTADILIPKNRRIY